MPLVLVRTPTYRRPDLLTRAMRCLQAQTHEDWICEVCDDCPDGSARAVVEETMLDIMFELPDLDQKGKFVITEKVVRGEERLFGKLNLTPDKKSA